MHEMAISESILSILEAEAARQKFESVKKLWLEIGPLSGIEPEALRFAFDAAKKGTLADAALLEIIVTQATAWCLGCERTVPIAHRFDPCPQCGGHRLKVATGEEMRIKELEVE